MRAILLIALVALAGTAAAEDTPKKPKSVVKPLDKSSPVLMQSQGGNDETHTERPKSKARDYNSSRSNTTSLMADKEGGDYNSSRSNKTHTPSRATAGDYNSSRSNNVNGVVDPDSDDDSVPTKRCKDRKDNDCNAAAPIAQGSLEKTRSAQKPANHNTTRSK